MNTLKDNLSGYITRQHIKLNIYIYIYQKEKGLPSQRFYYQQEGLRSIEKQNKPPLTERNRCIRCLCCACLPIWARWVVWFIIIAVIIIIIVFAALLATFTMPTMDFAGVTDSPTNQPEVSYNGHVLNFNFGLLINVKNPNILGIDLSNINATVSCDFTIISALINVYMYYTKIKKLTFY